MYIRSIAQNLEYSYYYHGRTQSPQISALIFFQPVSHAAACNIKTSFNIGSLAAPVPHCWLRPLPTLAPDSLPTTLLRHVMPSIFLYTIHTTNATVASLGIAACPSSKMGMEVNIPALHGAP